MSLILIPHRLLGNIYVRELGRAYQGLGHRVIFGPENLLESTLEVDTIHLHWPEEQYRSLGEGSVERRVATFLGQIDRHKARGGNLIWTVHNAIPHEHADSAVDRHAYQEVIHRADLIVHHCPKSIEVMSSIFTLPRAVRQIVAPHGNYTAYPDGITRSQARTTLGISQDAVVYLHFGSLRGYKGFRTVLDAFRRARTRGKFLLVAGKYTGMGGWRGKADTWKLALLNRFDPSIQLHLRSVDTDAIQVYLRASDAVLLGHGNALNSGVAVLGMTFGRLIIGPDIGCISWVLQQGSNLLYKANDVQALAAAMEAVPGLDLEAIGAVNLGAAQSWDWVSIARQIMSALPIAGDQVASVGTS